MILEALCIAALVLFLFSLREQYKVYKSEKNGLRNLRRAIMLYLKFMISALLMLYLNFDKIFIAIALFFCSVVSFLIHRNSQFGFLGLRFWKECFKKKITTK